ncbi:MAG: NAD(P)H-dependent oxidoreductase subunit E [Treponema sp.]|jgi:NADH:ubiquinone oxidoreductase subunit F (NADH-binding)/(2Fe-2S) ferredoxin/Pyruvate/2-oxoacid:ferredoxin oxidoreductase delta subunit|nr:NAD(P)H-dependent oxidoreductase subunit E [Treponema sp.]
MAYNHYILTCGGTACESNKGAEIFAQLNAEAERQGVKGEVQIVKTGCFGFCEQGPIVKVLPEESFYVNVKPEDAREIIAEQILKGREVKRLLYTEGSSKKPTLAVEDIQFYQKQFRVVLRNCGVINPENIDEYIGREGYSGLEKVLFEWTPEKIIEEMKISGMRGRGGAGFPTWLKWDLCRKAPGDVKYVICNADEGDPGAYMDRSTIEGDPHSVIEGMITAGKAIGANQGFVYIRAEYPLAIERLKIALGQARKYGLIGKNILGSGFDFEIEIRLGAGAFVCGEETALIKSVEGNRGMPVPKPPFPANKGLWQLPTIINNVETLANVPVITSKGGAWLAKLGTEKSKGTKVFALTGKVKNSGLVEVPMGTTLREIVFEIGGGIKGGKKFKGVQSGGPSGGILNEKVLDTPIDFESLAANGSMMGSGGLIVMDEDDCVVDVSRFYMDFCVDESCGKCSPCRIGTTQLLNILEKIAKGNGEEEDLEKLESIGKAMNRASLCQLGMTAPNPILSTLKNFREEYLEHIHDKKCRAGKCKHLISFTIDPVKCIGCGVCAKKCPANCIAVEDAAKYPDKKRPPYAVNQAECLKCGECLKNCKFGAINKG